MSIDQKKIANALHFAFEYGQIDGAHHKTWVIDQMVRALLGEASEPDLHFDIPTTYAQFVMRYRTGDGTAGPESYSWDEGTPP